MIQCKLFKCPGKGLFMNKNEECLLKFLKQPERLDVNTNELKRFIFSINDNIITTKEFAFTKNKPA